MGKMTKLLIVSSLALGSVTGCAAQPTDVQTGAKNNVEATATKQTQEKRFNANFSKDFDGVKVNVAEIVIKEDRVEVGINYQNNRSKKINWFPDQGQLLIGDMQLNVDILTQTGLTTGEIVPGAKSEGVLTFIPPAEKKIDISKVKELKFHLGEIISEDFMSQTKVDFTIPVK